MGLFFSLKWGVLDKEEADDEQHPNADAGGWMQYAFGKLQEKKSAPGYNHA